jgi:hypothetical protein
MEYRTDGDPLREERIRDGRWKPGVIGRDIREDIR